MKSVGRYAVMGNPIVHSLSPLIHQQFARDVGVCIEYERILVESNFQRHVHLFFQQGGLGLNITAPFKEQAFKMSEIRTARCQRAGAANTLWMKEGMLHADNTDGIGLCRVLGNVSGARILILGAGGAARGIIPALQDKGACVTLANRTHEHAQRLSLTFENIGVISFDEEVSDFEFVINTTGKNLEFGALPRAWLAQKPYCYDLTYHPEENTPFMHWANSHGCQASDGFSMLVEQAREAFAIWHGVFPLSPGKKSVLLRH